MHIWSKVALTLSLLGILVIVWYRYDQYVVEKNFLIYANVPCDPVTESCFVADCSPEEDEECDLTPYKKAELLQSEAPACTIEHACESFSCTGIDSCVETLCSEEMLEEGEACYVYEPPVEIEEETEEGNEEAEQGIENT